MPCKPACDIEFIFIPTSEGEILRDLLDAANKQQAALGS